MADNEKGVRGGGLAPDGRRESVRRERLAGTVHGGIRLMRWRAQTLRALLVVLALRAEAPAASPP